MIGVKKFLNSFSRYPRFFVVGVIGFTSNFLLSALLTEVFELWYLISVIIGTIVSWTVAFLLNSFFTFKGHSRENYSSKYFKNILLYTILAPIGFGLIYLLTSVAGLHYLISLTLVVGIMSFVSFAVFKKFVFDYKETNEGSNFSRR